MELGGAAGSAGWKAVRALRAGLKRDGSDANMSSRTDVWSMARATVPSSRSQMCRLDQFIGGGGPVPSLGPAVPGLD
jgi:hypothetical protein